MMAKTLIVWHGPKETNQTRAGAIIFSANELVVESGVYYLKNDRGEVVAEIRIPEGAHVREAMSSP